MAEDKTKDDVNKDVNDDVNDDVSDDSDDTQDDVKTYSEDDYKKLQTESINRKKKLDELKIENEKFKKDKLTESELKDLKIKELEADKDAAVKSKKDADVNAMITSQASTKGFGDFDVAILIIKDELKLEEDITEVTIKKAVDKVAKDKPYLIGGEDTKINAGNFKKGTKPNEEKSIDERFGDALRKGLGRNIL